MWFYNNPISPCIYQRNILRYLLSPFPKSRFQHIFEDPPKSETGTHNNMRVLRDCAIV